jgi:solute carrier family 25 phosphate transporter 3
MFSTLFSSSSLSTAAHLLPAAKPAAVAPAPTTNTVAFAGGNPDHDSVYYAKCMVGGILSCGLTHTAVVPLDVVKCRMQTNGQLYKGLTQGLSVLSKEGGFTLGWAPTLIGYSAQGFFKFGFYEIFKDVYSGMVDPETAFKYRNLLYLSASASAELIADVALCPWEATKVRMQTSPPEAKFPTSLGAAMSRINQAEGMNGFFKGLAPLWGRQVPYTMVKFAAFENIVEAFYKYMFTNPKESYSKATQLSITFASGYISGVFCAVVSQPADNLVSILNNQPGKSVGAVVNELGIVNLFTKGLGVRILMVGTLTGLQWYIYDAVKGAFGLKTSGGAKK